jgi:hypothetical protein
MGFTQGVPSQDVSVCVIKESKTFVRRTYSLHVRLLPPSLTIWSIHSSFWRDISFSAGSFRVVAVAWQDQSQMGLVGNDQLLRFTQRNPFDSL